MQTTKDGLTYFTDRRWPSNGDKSYQYLLVRLLVGAIQVSKTSVQVHQKFDFSTIPPSAQVKTSANAFADFLSSANIGGTTKKFIQVTTADNRDFFREILAEFGNYFVQCKRGNYATAFVHLYRTLERVLYSIPLLYSSTQRDFIGTFNDLKSLFKEELVGELGLFKKFLGLGRFIDPLTLDATSTIKFVSVNGYQSNYFSLTNRLYKNFNSTDSSSHEVSLTFKNTPDFMTILRNRLFHARTGDGQSNVKMQEVIDIDEYLNCLNPIFCNFLAIVILQIIASKYHI